MFALKYFQTNSNALNKIHIAIIIDIFGIPFVSEIGITCAFIVASVDVARIDLPGFMTAIRLGPIELVATVSFLLDFVGFVVVGTMVVRMIFGFSEVDEVFTMGFVVVDATLITFIVIVESFVGMIETVEFLFVKFLDVV